MLVRGVVRSFLVFEHIRAGGGGGGEWGVGCWREGSVPIGQYKSSLGWPTVGGWGLRELWYVECCLSWPTVAEFGRLSW